MHVGLYCLYSKQHPQILKPRKAESSYRKLFVISWLDRVSPSCKSRCLLRIVEGFLNLNEGLQDADQGRGAPFIAVIQLCCAELERGRITFNQIKQVWQRSNFRMFICELLYSRQTEVVVSSI